MNVEWVLFMSVLLGLCVGLTLMYPLTICSKCGFNNWRGKNENY